MRTKKEELTLIRDYLLPMSEGFKITEHDTLIYRMFGSLSKEQAQGVVIGLNLAIREMD